MATATSQDLYSTADQLARQISDVTVQRDDLNVQIGRLTDEEARTRAAADQQARYEADAAAQEARAQREMSTNRGTTTRSWF